MADQTLEERVAKLEAEMALLKAERLNTTAKQPSVTVPWWEKNIGIFKDDPDYLEAMRLGREYRESLRPDDEYPETT